jgi:hypothetical protein
VREREPTSSTEDLEIEVAGAIHRGQRLVLRVSDDEIRQEIRYEGLRQVDPDCYTAREADFMGAIAREILWRLVAQWKAGGVRKPVKVEPRKKGRQRSGE